MATAIISAGFNGVQFEEITRNNEPWIRVPQIEAALGYNKRGAVQMLYDRHADEFTDSMTAVVTLPTPGGPQETRIFSLRGCHLLAMFARTPVAKAFRVWVLDVLETLNNAQPLTNCNQLPDTPITPDQQCTLQAIVRAKVEAIPEAERSKGLYPQIWGRFKNHFRVSKYDQLPQSRMSEAVTYLTQMDVQQKALASAAGLPTRYSTSEAIETSLDTIRGQLFDKTVTFMHDMEEIARQARASFSDPKRVSNVGNEFDIFLSEQTQIISSLAEQAYHCGSLASRHIASLKLFAPRIKKIFG